MTEEQIVERRLVGGPLDGEVYPWRGNAWAEFIERGRYTHQYVLRLNGTATHLGTTDQLGPRPWERG